MASSILGSLAAGLRGAGATLSPQVFNAEQNYGLQQAAQENRIKTMQFQQQQALEQEKALANAAGPYLKNGDLSGAAAAVGAIPGGFETSLKFLNLEEQRKQRAELQRAAIENKKDMQTAQLQMQKDLLERRLEDSQLTREERRAASIRHEETLRALAAIRTAQPPKPPAGYEWDPERPDTLRGIKGGPADLGQFEGAFALAADQFLAGDVRAVQGYSRNAQMRALLAKKIEERARELGMGGKDIAAKMAQFQGIQAGQRTLGTRTANIEMAISEAQQLSQLALATSSEWKRSEIKSLNDLQRFAQSRTSNPQLRAFVAANNSFINVYARAINPTGVPTDTDKNHARDVLDVGFATGDYEAAIRQLNAEMDAARRAPGIVREEFRKAVVGEKELGGSSEQGGYVEGQIYEDANGNRAIWRNGKFEEVPK